MAKLTHRLIVKTGWYKKDSGEVAYEYSEIGRMVEFETKDGGRFVRLSVDAHTLNPALAQLALTCENTAPSEGDRKAQRKTGRVEFILQKVQDKAPQAGKAAARPPERPTTPVEADEEIPF